MIYNNKNDSKSVVGTDHLQIQSNNLQQSGWKSLCLGWGRGNRAGEVSRATRKAKG